VRVRGAVLREMGRPAPYARSRPLEIAELELDGPGPGEILVRVRAAGLCHSDLSVIDGSRPRVMPMVLGHEAAGEVVEIGTGVGTVSTVRRCTTTSACRRSPTTSSSPRARRYA
jgi:Zn-dependent alcohol dehydrogenase